LSLNSEVDAAPGSEQAKWLGKTLTDSPDSCVLAFYHKPAHSLKVRSGAENAILLLRQLQQADAAVVLNGHNHFYKRTKPLDAEGRVSDATGTIDFTSGTGGEVRPPRDLAPETDSAVFDDSGLLRLELKSDGFAWWFHETGDAEVLDNGEAACNQRMASL
jgi:hypothetical protein